jgi:hypothetical protein
LELGALLLLWASVWYNQKLPMVKSMVRIQKEFELPEIFSFPVSKRSPPINSWKLVEHHL